MPKLLSLSLSKNKKQCIAVFDNNSELKISTDLALKYSLSKGREVSEESIGAIISEQRIIEAKSTAYNYASYKFRTAFQVKDKLRQKNFSQSEIQAAIEFLENFDLLDDEKFSRQYIESSLQRKNIGKTKLLASLLEKSIDKSIAKHAIEQYYPEEDTLAIALRSAEKKLRLISNKPQVKWRSLLISHLLRQGFSYEIINKTVIALLER